MDNVRCGNSAIKEQGKIWHRSDSKCKDTNNLYTSHVPSFIDIVDRLIKGRLPEDHYPFVNPTIRCERPQEIIVFFINGSTYDEAYHLRRYSELLPGISFTLGGTCVHNTMSFLQYLNHLHKVLA